MHQRVLAYVALKSHRRLYFGWAVGQRFPPYNSIDQSYLGIFLDYQGDTELSAITPTMLTAYISQLRSKFIPRRTPKDGEKLSSSMIDKNWILQTTDGHSFKPNSREKTRPCGVAKIVLMCSIRSERTVSSLVCCALISLRADN